MTFSYRTLLAALLLAAVAAWAVETKKWVVNDAQDYDSGELRNIALSSKGRVSLAPAKQLVIDTGAAQIWAVAADGRGNVYAGGADGKVYVSRNGAAATVLASLEGGSVFALTLDAKAEVVAGVSPSGKIYRITAAGQASLINETKTGYIWALVHDKAGTLYAATGEPGRIVSVPATGQSRVVFEAGESHVRSLALDSAGNLIAGTEPGGTVVRVNTKGEAFLLLQTSKREVTAVASGSGGVVFVAASGARTPAAPAPATPITVPRPAATPAQTPQGGEQQPAQSQQTQSQRIAPVTIPGVLATPTGGSEIYRIEADGEPRSIWSSTREIVYSLAVDAKGTLYAATGNEGRVYRIDSADEHTRIAGLEAPQVTALTTLASGAVLAATANPGQVYQLGPGLTSEGAVESDVFDAKAFTYWGGLTFQAAANGGTIVIETRSGNGERAQKLWSDWKPLSDGRVVSPASRYLGWRATLKAAAGGTSPVLSKVEVAYQQKNVAPSVGPVEMTPPNHKFSGTSSSLTATATINLPAIGQSPKDNPPAPNTAPAGTATMTYDHGWQGARWKASDLNGDTLLYTVEIRGEGESVWKPVKSDLKENRIAFDTAPWTDGRYVLKVITTDKVDNYPGEGLKAESESDPFIIDNTPPEIAGLTARVEGGKVIVRFSATDALSALNSAEMSVNGGEWVAVKPSTRMTDSLHHDYAAETAKPAESEITVAVRVYDERDNVAVRKTVIRP
jgi:sugar lactone lactonase YvrE